MSLKIKLVVASLVTIAIILTILAVHLRHLSFQHDDKSWPEREAEMRQEHVRTGRPVENIPDRHWSHMASPMVNLAAALVFGSGLFLLGHGKWDLTGIAIGLIIGGVAWALAILPWLLRWDPPIDEERSALLVGIPLQTIAMGGPVASALFLLASERIWVKLLGLALFLSILIFYTRIYFVK
jgi:hypothetical protein